ncbi:MAG: SDR family oxidoreductase [Bacteroidales bacterium]|nr:SDR family oxidoreductase [Bacteroidales bacterium]
MSYNLLKGKKGIIFGALNDASIAWKVAEHVCDEGAEIVLTNTPTSIRLGEIEELAKRCGAPVFPADATNETDLSDLVEKTMEHFGSKIDFVLHSIGMSPNVRKGIPYEEINYTFMQKTLDVSAISFHKLLQVLYAKDAVQEGGSILALTYIAAERAFSGYGDMADAKALLESITRSFGLKYGKHRKVRVNTISQSPTLTTAGQGVSGMKDMFRYADTLSPLGNASADDCADYVVSLFSDLTRKVTMQNFYHDGGFSSTGLTTEVLDIFMKGLEV